MPLQGRDWEWRQNLEALMLLAMSDWNEKGSHTVFQQASTDSATHQSDCHMRLEVASTPLVPISRSFHCTRHFTEA